MSKMLGKVHAVTVYLVCCQVVNDSLVPLLVCRATPEASQALKYIAAAMKTVSTRKSEFMLISFTPIVLYINCPCDPGKIVLVGR